LKCCGGADGFIDWNNNIYFNCSENNPSRERCGVPYSCCRPVDDGSLIINTQCGYDTTDKSSAEVSDRIYTVGCISQLVKFVNSNLYLIGGVSLGIAVLQILGIFLARILHTQIDEQKTRFENSKQQNQYMSRF
ncbi:tetraspanin-33-like, partial [Saccoglossus kowalevskii]|uniref:Tetraspanin-33-like n=1 Tax=Saccoglossus kowalevskii TaxID=10224 RepID=A0ABM0LYQ7_SACKO